MGNQRLKPGNVVATRAVFDRYESMRDSPLG